MTTTNHPAYVAAVRVEPQEDDATVWRQIGAAWPLKSGRGLSLILDEAPSAKTRIFLFREEKSDRSQAGE